MSDSTNISLELEGDLATIFLQPPDGKPPTLDLQTLEDLEKCVGEIQSKQARVVLVRSTSVRFFCLGANLNALSDIDEHTISPWVLKGHQVFNKIEDLAMPVIAVVEGYAMGGGLELAMACDLILSSREAKFAQSEAGLGFIPGWGGTHRLTRRIGVSKAKLYFYSGKMLDAQEAAEIGLVDLVAKPGELETELHDYSQSILSANRNAISQFKTILNDQQRALRDEIATIEASHSVTCLQDPDTKKRLDNFLTKKGKK
jgi:enoyl-CoA hydratase/carnithine racemase